MVLPATVVANGLMPPKRAQKEQFNMAGTKKKLPAGNRVLLSFERRLLEACRFHLRRKPIRNLSTKLAERAFRLHQEIQSAVDTLRDKIDEIGSVDPAFNVNAIYLLDAEKNLAALCNLSRESTKRVKQRIPAKRRGPKSIIPDLALLIYSALELAKGDRSCVDRIGNLIAQNGELMRRIDREFGSGAYASLNIPTPNFKYDQRWERGLKEQLRQASESYAFSSDGFSVLREHHPGLAERHFDSVVRRGGYSEYEISQELDR
jgi:hypothetical protein